MAISDNTAPAIEAAGLTKIFRDFWHRPKVAAVQGIDFEVRRGEVFGLLGPNGSGKSTTIKMLLGLLHPSRGSLRILGRSPRDVKVKERIGYLPEESHLYPYLTSAETMDFYGRLFDLPSVERRKRIEQLLEMIGLQHARNRRVGEFSKGMMRRIGLAQALINDPDLVILDEPTSGLDPIGCRQMKDLILTLSKRGKTVVMSSHLLADVEDVCDRVAILYNGKVQAMGAIDDLLEEKTRHRVTLPGDLAPEQLKQALAMLRDFFGREPEVDHPRRDLEQFFLAVVEKARQQTSEASGATAGRAVADYLAAGTDHAAADAKLSSLVTDAPKPAVATESHPAQPAQDLRKADEALSGLVKPPPSNRDKE